MVTLLIERDKPVENLTRYSTFQDPLKASRGPQSALYWKWDELIHAQGPAKTNSHSFQFDCSTSIRNSYLNRNVLNIQ